jgi:hypothetical protein
MVSIHKLIESKKSSGMPMEVLVRSGSTDHATQDSLPLRFGVYFEQETIITIEHVASYEKQVNDRRKKAEIRYKVLGTVLINDKRFPDTTVILSDETKQERPYLITIWRNDTNTELGLSDLLSRLRKRGQVDPRMLIDLFPSYDSGFLKSRDDLVVALREHDKLSPKLNFEKIQNDLEESISNNELLKNENVEFRDLVKQLERDKAQRESEKIQASAKSQVPTPSNSSVLIRVIENKQINNSQCTVLLFSDGSQKQMKMATWDASRTVTQKALSLVGRRVFTTCWDPKNEPGKWSNMGYFKNIYIATEIEDLEE